MKLKETNKYSKMGYYHINEHILCAINLDKADLSYTVLKIENAFSPGATGRLVLLL